MLITTILGEIEARKKQIYSQHPIFHDNMQNESKLSFFSMLYTTKLNYTQHYSAPRVVSTL